MLPSREGVAPFCISSLLRDDLGTRAPYSWCVCVHKWSEIDPIEIFFFQSLALSYWVSMIWSNCFDRDIFGVQSQATGPGWTAWIIRSFFSTCAGGGGIQYINLKLNIYIAIWVYMWFSTAWFSHAMFTRKRNTIWNYCEFTPKDSRKVRLVQPHNWIEVDQIPAAFFCFHPEPELEMCPGCVNQHCQHTNFEITCSTHIQYHSYVPNPQRIQHHKKISYPIKVALLFI